MKQRMALEGLRSLRLRWRRRLQRVALDSGDGSSDAPHDNGSSSQPAVTLMLMLQAPPGVEAPQQRQWRQCTAFSFHLDLSSSLSIVNYCFSKSSLVP